MGPWALSARPIIHFQEVPGEYILSAGRLLLVIVMDAYGDRSWHGGQRLYAIAAFLARSNEWAHFQLGWRRILDEAGVEVFHMTDFMAGQARPYKDWTEKKRQLFFTSLLRTIAQHVEYGGAAIMLPEGYKALLERHAERTASGRLSLGDNPYAICADTCIGLINLKLIKTGWTNRRVAYFFEQGDPGQGEFYASVSTILRHSLKYRDDNRVLSVTTVAKRDAAALQTADILAYEFTHCRADRSEFTDHLRYLSSISPAQIEGFYINDNIVNEATEGYTEDVFTEIVREHNLAALGRRKQRKRRMRRET